MKKIRASFLTIMIGALMSGVVFAQSAGEIAAVRAKVAAIDKNVKSYQKTKKDVDGISGEGTEATYFTSGKGLKKITAKIYGETFRATVEIYYAGEEPVFAFQLEERYNKPMYLKGSKVAGKTETRFYYSGDQLIKLMTGKRTVAESEESYGKSKDGMKELADKLKAAYFAPAN